MYFEVVQQVARSHGQRRGRMGNSLGAYFPECLLDTPLDYEEFAKGGGVPGHGSVMAFDDTVSVMVFDDSVDMARPHAGPRHERRETFQR